MFSSGKSYAFANPEIWFWKTKAVFDKINVDFRLIKTFLRVKSKRCF